jgi:GNAT superfamily N-acetyltransferase
MSPSIVYAVESRLRTADFIDVLRRSGLAERRPVDDPARIDAMLRHANLIVTARADGLLVGVARSVTDFSFCCYLSDLAVDKAWQGKGIGRRLMVETRDAASRDITDNGGRPLRCLLLSAPAVLGYYPKAGLAKLDNAFDFTNL